MKRYMAVLLFCLAGTTVSIPLSAEGRPHLKFFNRTRNDAGIGYNFFLGEEAELFSTSIKGFGSGFLMDVNTGRFSIDVISLGGDRVDLSLGLGASVNKYRFSNNLLFETLGGITYVLKDPFPGRDYVNSFFGYGKSKLVYGSLFFPLNLNISLGSFFISGGILIDQYLSGKYKMKYIEDGEKKKEVIRNNEWRDYNLNKTKWGLNGELIHKTSGIGLAFTYMLTPFFVEGKGPEVQEARLSLFFRMQ